MNDQKSRRFREHLIALSNLGDAIREFSSHGATFSKWCRENLELTETWKDFSNSEYELAKLTDAIQMNTYKCSAIASVLLAESSTKEDTPEDEDYLDFVLARFKKVSERIQKGATREP